MYVDVLSCGEILNEFEWWIQHILLKLFEGVGVRTMDFDGVIENHILTHLQTNLLRYLEDVESGLLGQRRDDLDELHNGITWTTDPKESLCIYGD